MTKVDAEAKRYIVTQKELKEKLGLEGEIKEIGLWSGRSPLDVERGKSTDTDEYFIDTLIEHSEKREKNKHYA